MLFLEITSLVIVSVYFIFTLYLISGTLKQVHYTKANDIKKITVLVPAKDEEKNISYCLNALSNQSMEPENYEVIVLNDNSNDNTRGIVEKFLDKTNNFSLINLSETSENHLIGKSRAISIGVKHAKNDIILICDADCRPNYDWVLTISKSFTEKIGIVSGFTLLENDKMSLFDIVQNLDWIILQGVASGAVGIGMPISCIGSNFAFRKSAYNEVGGYESLHFSITEDLLLYKTLSKKTDWRFVYPLLPESINISLPMDSMKKLYEQRKRWAIGSLGIGGFGLFTMSLNTFAHIIPIINLILGSGNIFVLSGLFFVDIVFISHLLIKLKRIKYIKYVLHYFIYYYFNILIFPIMFLFDRKVIWKDRVYNKGIV